MSVKRVNNNIVVTSETVAHMQAGKNHYLFNKIFDSSLSLLASTALYLTNEYMKNSSTIFNNFIGNDNFIGNIAQITITAPLMFKAIKSAVNVCIEVYSENYMNTATDLAKTIFYSSVSYASLYDLRFGVVANLVESVYETSKKLDIYNTIIDHINVTGEDSFIIEYNGFL